MQKLDLYINGKNVCKISLANNFWTRFMGLMGKSEEQICNMGGLMIKPCSQIHTFFMKAPIDVVYINKDGKAVQVDEAVPKAKCCKRVKKAKYLIEFPEGTIKRLKIKEEDVLEVK